MSVVGLVAGNTIRQIVRQRTFFNVFIFGLGMVIVALVVSNITFGYRDQVVRSIGLSGVILAVDLMALLLSIGLIHAELDRKTLFVVMTRPVTRTAYVLGRALGLFAVLSMAMASFGLVVLLTLLSVGGAPTLHDVYALSGGLVEAGILGSFGLVLSAFTTPMLGTGIGLGFWIAASTTDDLVRLARLKGDNSMGEALHSGNETMAQALSYVLPNFQVLNFRTEAVYRLTIPGDEFAWALVYGVLWIVGFLLLAGLILSRRELV
ncbi:MAG: ABC transporter permease subunit [Myxococcota bacterium]